MFLYNCRKFKILFQIKRKCIFFKFSYLHVFLSFQISITHTNFRKIKEYFFQMPFHFQTLIELSTSILLLNLWRKTILLFLLLMFFIFTPLAWNKTHTQNVMKKEGKMEKKGGGEKERKIVDLRVFASKLNNILLFFPPIHQIEQARDFLICVFW